MNQRIPTKALLAAVALLLAAPVPAAAQDTRTDDWLYLTVTTGDARSSDTRGTLLMCDPPQGHAHAVEACAELEAAGGDITAIPPKDGLCTMIYAPVTARARGQWDGRPLEYEETFANACVMGLSTGAVFAFGD